MAAVARAPDVLRERDAQVIALGALITAGKDGLRGVPKGLRAVIEQNAWRERRVSRLGGKVVAFKRFIDFVTTSPPEGLGATVELLQNLVRDDPITADVLDQALNHGQGERKDIGAHPDNGMKSPAEQGNTRTYALRRLRKDRPELHAQVLAGEKSAHRAMLEAGFRHRPDGLKRLQRAWAEATDAERQAFLKWM